MWFLVSVVKGSRYFEADSQIGNLLLISDTSELVISGRSAGGDGYRFEARKNNENFIVNQFPGPHAPGVLTERFLALAQQFGAVNVSPQA